LIAVGGSAMITTAALGIRAIGKLSYLAVPLLLAGLAYALSSVLAPENLAAVLQFHPLATDSLTFGAAAAMVAGGFIVGASMNPDYARFARSKGHAIAYSLTDYAVVYPLLLIVCGLIAVQFGDKNITGHLAPASVSWLLFVMMMFATWAANDCNLYSSSLGLAAVLPRVSRSHLAIMAGAIGIMLAELHVAEHMVSFLTLLGIIIAPVSGVFIVSALGRKEPASTEELERAPDWRVGPLFAWLSGAAVGYVATPTAALGLGVIQLTTVPPLDSVLVASIVMFVIKMTGEQPQHVPFAGDEIVAQPRQLVGAVED
jgi:cytosine permease